MKKYIRKSKSELIPGTLIKCASGRYLAYYEHRTDIIANGENERDAKANLRKMYTIVKKHEKDDPVNERYDIDLPPHVQKKTFSDKVPAH